jgi:hypothetical protein
LTIPKLQNTLKMCDKSRTLMPTTSHGLWREQTYIAVAPHNLMLATKRQKAQQPIPVESFSQSHTVPRPSHLSTTSASDLHYQSGSSSTACSSATDNDWLGLCDCSVSLIPLALFVMWL